MPRITRWSPLTCDCVIEIETDAENQIHQFLLLNNVCDKHKPLASTSHRAEHMQLSTHVLDIIEEAKASNLKQVDDAIAAETSAFKKKGLIQARNKVLEFNARLDEEWAELVSYPHAFDSHIHEAIKGEQN